MIISYSDINFDDLRGDLVADYLISVDAELRITEGDRVIYEESGFPVVELARSLTAWLDAAGHGDFEFSSLSTDERGLVTVTSSESGWTVYSSASPEIRSSALSRPDAERCLRDFVAKVASDLQHRGIDPARVLG